MICYSYYNNITYSTKGDDSIGNAFLLNKVYCLPFFSLLFGNIPKVKVNYD